MTFTTAGQEKELLAPILVKEYLRAEEDNDDVIESFSLYYIFSVFPIDPLSEGLVTPPLGVEKLSPRLNFLIICFLA